MALDLTPLRPRLEELILVDRCELWRDVEGAVDDVTDPITGAVTSSTGLTLLETVQCKLRPVYRAYPSMSGGEPHQVGTFELAKPADSVAMKSGDSIHVIESPHHHRLVDVWFRVSENLYSSLSLFMKARLEIRERPSDRP